MNNTLIKKIYLIILFLAHPHIYSAKILTGQNDAPENQTFTKSIQKIVKSNGSKFTYVAQSEGAASFAISRVGESGTAFTGIIPLKANVNGQEQNDNPLFDQNIFTFGLLEENADMFSKKDFIIAVTQNNPTVVQLTKPASENEVATVTQTTPIHDATGMNTQAIKAIETDRSYRVFAAVTPNDFDEFGATGSGVALVIQSTIKTKNEAGEEVLTTIFGQLDKSGKIVELPEDITAIPVDGTVLAVKKGGDATIANAIDMHWDAKLQRLFCALQVTSSGDADSGARALVVGRQDETEGFIFEPIIADDLLTAGSNNQIIATDSANQAVTLHRVKTMLTSTDLPYVIVVGNNGINTQDQVFALPLVSNAGNDNGKIANKNSDPQNTYFKTDPKLFISRDIKELPQTPTDLPLNTDTETQVGSGQLLAGNITDITVFGDSVFALVANPVNAQSAGVYVSRAIFQANGKIKAWTNWQRAIGTNENVFALNFDTSNGQALFFTDTQDNLGIPTVAQITDWSATTEHGEKIISATQQLLSKENGFSQHLWNFASRPGASQLALLIAADANSIVLINSGQVQNGVLIPTMFTDIISSDTTVDQNISDTFALKFSGTILEDIGPITACTVARNENTNETFLVVGGLHGVVTLSTDAGNGITGELQSGFAGITAGMSFKKIGNYTNMRKLIADQNFLYILTDSTLDRIDITNGTFGLGQITPTTVAATENFSSIRSHGSFLDCIISGSVSILATTAGVFHTGVGGSIVTATNPADVVWSSMIFAESVGAPIKLYTLSKTDNPADIARNDGGNVFVLFSDKSLNQSRIYRIAVEPIENNPVAATTITQFNDQLIENEQTFFLSFGRQKQGFFSDGARTFVSQNKNRDIQQAQVDLVTMRILPRVGSAGVGNRQTTVSANIVGATEISNISCDPALGAFLISTDDIITIGE